MKKIFKLIIIPLIIILLTGIIKPAVAQIADERTVTCVAKNVFFERANSAGFNINLASLENYKLTSQSNDKDEIVFYTFNFEIGGWIIIAADMNIDPIIGYNFSETLDLESLPEPLKDVLIENAKIYQFNSQEIIHPNWIKYADRDFTLTNVRTVGPLVQLPWGQHGGYNDNCPMINTTSHGYVGCGPLAMGMIIAYHKYPDNACAYNSLGGIEQWTNCTYSNPSLVVIDNLNRDYNWNQMSMTHPDQYNKKLLFHCGIMANACYKPSSTSIQYSSQAYIAMVENFKYKYRPVTEAQVFKGNYSFEEFCQILINEIEYDRPMLGFLVKSGYNGGHVVVISGYQNTSEFHINWGYFGNSNGFYNLSNPLIDPYDPNNQYNLSSIYRFIEPKARKKMSVHKNFETATTENFSASEIISTISEIKNGAQISLLCRKRIKMLPGFKVDNNSKFSANIGLGPSLEPTCGDGYDPYDPTDKINDHNDIENKELDLNTNLQTRLFEISAIDVRPNPTQGILDLHIHNPSIIKSIVIINAYNQNVYELKQIQKNSHINISHLPKGLYFMIGKSNTGTEIKKIILQ